MRHLSLNLWLDEIFKFISVTWWLVIVSSWYVHRCPDVEKQYSTNQSIDQSISQLTSQPINQLTQVVIRGAGGPGFNEKIVIKEGFGHHHHNPHVHHHGNKTVIRDGNEKIVIKDRGDRVVIKEVRVRGRSSPRSWSFKVVLPLLSLADNDPQQAKTALETFIDRSHKPMDWTARVRTRGWICESDGWMDGRVSLKWWMDGRNRSDG